MSAESVLATLVFGLEILLMVFQWGFAHEHRNSTRFLGFWVGRCLLVIASEAVPLGILWHEYQLGRPVSPLALRSGKLVILVALWWNVLSEVRSSSTVNLQQQLTEPIQGLWYYYLIFAQVAKYGWALGLACALSLLCLSASLILLIVDQSPDQSGQPLGQRYSIRVRYLTPLGYMALRLSVFVAWAMIYKSFKKKKFIYLSGCHLCFLILPFIVMFFPLLEHFNIEFYEILVSIPVARHIST